MIERQQPFIMPAVREVRFTGQPEIHQAPAFITTQNLDVQQYQLFNLELAWAHGPFTLQSEGTLAEIDLANKEKDLDQTMWPEPGSDADDFFHGAGVSEFSAPTGMDAVRSSGLS